MQKLSSNADWATRARAVLPGGGFGNFDPSVFIKSGSGARVIDEDGREYVDYLIGSGPMLLGHDNAEVLEAIYETLPRGLTFFANNATAIELAEEICRAVPGGEQLRYVSSGGEADMYAMRLARAYTGRDKIVKFEGGYHGMSAEAQMSLAPEKRANFPQAIPDSAGIPPSVAAEMLIAPFNDFDYIRSLMAEWGPKVAAIIVEPLQRIIPPLPGYLQLLREEADKYGCLLVFDEVVTGFRLSYGGAQELYCVTPDITTLGKAIGGGFPLAALVASAEIMAHFDKTQVGAEGWLMQLGTLSGNPVAAAAGLKTLEILRRDGQYDTLRANGQRVMNMTRTALDATGFGYEIVGDPTLFEVVFTDAPVRDYRDVQSSNTARATAYNETLRQEGIFKAAGKTYPSLPLTEGDFAITEAAIQKAAADLT
ncbi:aspartate aminotransferase family protein [Shimia abyssi]|uniref:Glutamate-1-semialdehyde 2,1-aminomutase n=1 Tax=Shimia abyssi TaxID=1662395 RepID=A0A2P8FJY5_9RHOB|nr:aminotransferase class III-fold pyridoxal phosphate-dependent enzyme [Shimia abyssi]PSL22037.1 glutamate-1-semialdehyde 2,1-aminomutase [Shimia abyssi]